MKKIFVGTVFCGDNEMQRHWLDLQLAFLKATTIHDYDHYTYLYSKKSDYFEQRSKVIYASNPIQNSSAHIEGLNSILAHARYLVDFYDEFLFLDSDAFPIKIGWRDFLVGRMNKHHIATALRTENLETRWHASILFSNREGLDNLKFGYLDLKDLSGLQEKDVSIINYQNKLRDKVFPLIRSNQYNAHPHLCGIYYDMFYHHCCGSGREYNMKSRWYWDDIINVKSDLWYLWEELFSNPNEFIAKLAGWKKESYGKIENTSV